MRTWVRLFEGRVSSPLRQTDKKQILTEPVIYRAGQGRNKFKQINLDCCFNNFEDKENSIFRSPNKHFRIEIFHFCHDGCLLECCTVVWQKQTDVSEVLTAV